MSWRDIAKRAQTRTTELDFFTDRTNHSRLFIDRMNNDVAGDSRIIFFHGVGGAGKSLLLSQMEMHLCKRFDVSTWNSLARLNEEICVQRVIEATSYEQVPLTKLDFAPRPNISDDVRDSYQGLMKIRRDLGAAGVRCSLFDFAVTTYLQKSNRLTREQIAREFPANEVGLALDIAGLLLSPIPFASLVTSALNVSNRHFGGWFGERQIQNKVDRENIEAILTIDPEKELLPALPEMLAEDITTYLSSPQAPPRIVMLFDTHEAFWERHRGEGVILYEQRDEWLRRLLGGIAHCDRVVAVVAGREVPRWTTASAFPISTSQIDLHLVGNLPDADAKTYLELRQIHDQSIQHRLVEEARVYGDQIHPFSLGLAADAYDALIESGRHLEPHEFEDIPGVEERRRRLIDRFLQWVEIDIRDAIMALGLARSFDNKLYAYLGRIVGFPTSRSHFDVITGFSFATIDPESTGSYRMHDLLRRYLGENRDEDTVATEKALEDYFRAEDTIERLRERAHIEAVYHRATYDESGAGDEFVEVFDHARQTGHYETCRLLIELAGDLELTTLYPAARIHAKLADYHTFMARYDVAFEHIARARSFLDRMESNQDLVNSLRGDLLTYKGQAKRDSGDRESAATAFADSITAYDTSLALRPDDPATLSNKGDALLNTGRLHVSRGNLDAATTAFHDAITAYDASLIVRPDEAATLSNKGNALLDTGCIHVSCGDHQAAETAFHDAIAAHDASLAIRPDDPATLSNKGNVLLDTGRLHVSRGNREAAAAAFTNATAAYEASLVVRPGHPDTLSNKGNALLNTGRLQMTHGDHQAAETTFAEATAAYEASLTVRPAEAATLSNKGNALLNTGRLQVSCGNREAAATAFADSIDAYEASLTVRPGHPITLSNRGDTLLNIGRLHMSHGDHQAAATAFADAIAAHDASLVVRPGYPLTLSNKGDALLDTGCLHMSCGDHKAAATAFTNAIAAYEASLVVRSNHLPTMNMLETAHTYLGNVLINLGDARSALDAHIASSNIARNALDQSPTSAAFNSLAGIFVRLARSQMSLPDQPAALESIAQSLLLVNQGLELESDNSWLLGTKGSALHVQGELHYSEQHIESAERCFQDACDLLLNALSHQPEHPESLRDLGWSQSRLGEIAETRGDRADALSLYSAAVSSLEESLTQKPADRFALDALARAEHGRKRTDA